MVIFSIVIVLVLVFIFRLNLPKIKGSIGESKVARQLNKLNYEEYEVLHDILIMTNNGTSQIDHVVVSIYGVFVIETKNYSGWIHGNENSEYWTQSIYKYKTKFRNPIKQNWSHVYALKDILLDFRQIIYHPIIVFTGSAELKNINSTIPIIYVWELFQTIMDKRDIHNLSIEQVRIIADKLGEANILDKKIKNKHIHQVKYRAYERKQKEKSLICPKCGVDLVVRNGQYGKFYGCPNYPKCKYTLRYRK